MILVPLKADKVQTANGLPQAVAEISAYAPAGPSVIVRSPLGVKTIPFSEITHINGKEVKLLKNDEGYNVFGTDSFVERKFQLPQVGEVLQSRISGVEVRKYEVQRIRLHVPQMVTRGIVLNCIERDAPTKDIVEITLPDILDIEQTIFNRVKFLDAYVGYFQRSAS